MTYPISNRTNEQRSYTTFPSRPPPSLPTFPISRRAESPYDNLYKPLPPYSVQAYPPATTYTTSSLSSSSVSSTGSAYKPYVPFQAAPLSSSFISSASSRIPPSTFYNERPIDRPETLQFRYSEDLRSPVIDRPPPESPITPIDLKVEPELTTSDSLSSSTSKPIQILETTINKYDSLINQISEVLASVSPLSSTISSLSSGKNVLDYQLSSDDSPTLQQRDIDDGSSQQSTATERSTSAQRRQPSYLIREDSYDKIVTAISDMDTHITSLADQKDPSAVVSETVPSAPIEEPLLSTIPQEENESSTASSVDEEQQPVSSDAKEDEFEGRAMVEEAEEEANIPTTDEPLTSSPMVFENQEATDVSVSEHTPSAPHQILSVIEEDEGTIPAAFSTTDEEQKEAVLTSEEPKVEEETSIVDSTSNGVDLEETKLDDGDIAANKKNGKHVTWSESVVDNEDEDGSLEQNVAEEISDSDAVLSVPLDQPTAPIYSEELSILPASNVQSLIHVPESTEDLLSQSSLAEQLIQPQASTDVSSTSTTDSLQESESIRNEVPPTIDTITHDDNASQLSEDAVSKEEVRDSEDTTVSTTPSLTVQQTILSPIDSLVDSVTTRYISSDVYHGYLGQREYHLPVSKERISFLDSNEPFRCVSHRV